MTSTEGRDSWTDGRRIAKMYNIMERRGDIRRLSGSQRNVEELLDRRKRLHLYLTDLLEKKQSRIDQMKKLKRLKQWSNEWMAKATQQKMKLDQLTQKWRHRQQSKTASLKGLIVATGNLGVRSLRVSDADVCDEGSS